MLSWVVISGACPTKAPETQPHITAASSSSKTLQKQSKKTHQQAGQARSFPILEGHAGTKAQLIEPCGIPHNHSAFQRRYFFIIARDCVSHLQVKFAVSQEKAAQSRQNVSQSIHLSSHWHQTVVAFLCCHPVLSVFLSATNTTPKHTRPWKHANTMVQQTRSLHIPMNPNATFVSTQCVLHKERKQELCNKAFEALLCQK